METPYKTILINLNKDIDRLDFMTKQLGDLNMSFERLEAVHGKEYMEKDGSEYDEELAISRGGRKLSLGEIGCALSHKRCYQKFLNDPEYKDTKYLLILEDDVELDKNFKTILENEIKKNEENYKWNYLQFNYPVWEYSLKEKYKNQIITLKSSESIKTKIKRISFLLVAPIFSSFLDLRYYFLHKKNGVKPFFVRIHALTGAYLIDKKIAKILLTLTEKIIKPSDIIISHDLYKYKKEDLNFYFYTPLLARQKEEDFESSINKIEKRSYYFDNNEK